jgi:predicted 2-oxoglutarate/Fe(II)-dependent dioxygenase YbiX
MSRLFEIGERFPDFVLPGSSGQPTQLYSRVGGRPVLVLIYGDTFPGLDQLIERFAAEVDVVLVSDRQSTAEHSFVDSQGDLLRSHLGDASQMLYVLDANLRVLKRVEGADPVSEITQTLEPLSSEDSSRIQTQAPVLTVERVLEPDRCAFLMALWETGGSVETGIEKSANGGRDDVLSTRHKIRRDHTVDDPTLVQLLTQSIGKRVLSEIERAFVYKPTRFEGFKIACYESESSGFFGAHRDNLSPSTAHRRLAVSLNLNDEYAGGELRFPEFGEDRYCPGAGSAVVFSCAHLHEVLPVTEGRRFTLLTFLYDETAKRQDVVDPFSV